MTGIEDVLDPTDVNIFRDLAGGLTVANVLHGSANPIGGKNSVIKLRWGKTRPGELLFEGAHARHQVRARREPEGHAPGGGRRSSSRRAAIPATRLGVEYVIRDAFTRAKAYQREWQDYDGAARVPATTPGSRRAAICSSSRSSRFSKASASCTRTRIAPTRS